MGKSKVSIECNECQKSCEILFEGRETIECCPFCGEAYIIINKPRKLLNSFDDYDQDDSDESEAED